MNFLFSFSYVPMQYLGRYGTFNLDPDPHCKKCWIGILINKADPKHQNRSNLHKTNFKSLFNKYLLHIYCFLCFLLSQLSRKLQIMPIALKLKKPWPIKTISGSATLHEQCCGSGFKLPGWIRIRNRNPDPASEIGL